MTQVTFRIPKAVLENIDKALDPQIDERRSDFFRKAAVERLKDLGIEVKKND